MKEGLYINGEWVKPIRGENTFSVINPANEKVIREISVATKEDVDVAVEAARQAFERTG